MPSHRHRHQSSLEKVLDFSKPFSLPSQQSESATNLLNILIQHYNPERTAQKGYKPAALIQATHEHVLAKDTFLNFFFSYIYENLCSEAANSTDYDITVILSYFDNFTSWSLNQKDKVKSAMEDFADYIVESFLLPLRASSVKTPQPTPTSLSAIQTSTPAGTPYRVSILRQRCLVRDRHRCVISRKFDKSEARKRFEQDGEDCKDDEGKPLKNESNDRFQYLEVAHILPHCLMTVASGDTDLSESKRNVLRILDMFDPGVVLLIDGPNIDSPSNALTLTLDYHRMFGEFQIYFESTNVPCQYRIDSTERSPFLRDPLFPVTRTLTLSPGGTINPPSERFLNVHRAIALIMKLSGAGGYIENILRDMEEVHVKADGSTNLGYITSLRLDGWLNTLTVY